MVSRLTPSPGVTFLAGDCSVILYLPQALEFLPSRISLKADGSVLLQALCLELSIRVPGAPDGTGIRLQAGLPEHLQLPWAEMKAQSQADAGPG